MKHHDMVFSRGEHSVVWDDRINQKPHDCMLAIRCNSLPTTGYAKFTSPRLDEVQQQPAPCCVRCATEQVIRLARQSWPLTLPSAHKTPTSKQSATSTSAPAAEGSALPLAAQAATVPAQSVHAPSAKRNSRTNRNSKDATNAKVAAGSPSQ